MTLPLSTSMDGVRIYSSRFRFSSAYLDYHSTLSAPSPTPKPPDPRGSEKRQRAVRLHLWQCAMVSLSRDVGKSEGGALGLAGPQDTGNLLQETSAMKMKVLVAMNRH